MAQPARLTILLAATALAGVPRLAHAQLATSSLAPEQIVVTAQKRKEKLQQVPIAITVVSAAQLQQQQVNTVGDLARTSPALEINQASPGGGAQIRGIGTQSFTPSAEASVGIVVDGVPQGNVNISNIFDVQNLEILRGPQGMLFGQSTSAGVIVINTNAPDLSHFYATLHSEIDSVGMGSQFATQLVEGVVNIPIDNASALRLSGYGNFQQGLYQDNYNGKNYGFGDGSIRARYLRHITDDLTINIIADYDSRHTYGYGLFAATSPLDPFTNAALASCGITPNRYNQKDCSSYPNSSIVQNYGASVQLDYKIGDSTITSISSYRRAIEGPHVDDTLGFGPNAPITILDPSVKTSNTLIEQELRLTSASGRTLEYTAGVFYSDYHEQIGGLPSLLIFPGIPPIPSGNFSTTIIDSEAAYGQLTYHILPALQAIAGGRFTHETVSDSEQIYGVGTNGGSAVENNFSWRVGLQYTINPNLMTYVTATRGYKGPQVNDVLPGVPATIVQPEIPTDIELGVKGTTLHNRLAVDLNLFHSVVKNYQGQTCVITPQLVCGPANVPQVVTQGVELDLFGRPLPGLSINSGLIYDPVKYPNNYLASDGTNLGGTQLTNAPELKYTISGEYIHDLFGHELFIDTDAVYKSADSLYPSAAPGFVLPPHWIIGGRIGWRDPEAGWSIGLFVRNLLNTPEPVQLFANNPGVLSIWGPTSFRTVGLVFDAKL